MTRVGRSKPTAPLGEAQRLAWLRLARSEHVGATTFHRLIERYGDAETALEALPELARRGGAGRRLKLCSRDAAESEMERAERLNCRFVASCEPAYPPALAAADACPPLLAVRGSATALQKPSVAIVGSRNASFNGLKIAGDLSAGVASRGFSVTSGLARGIDAEAHKAALKPGTIAVLAGGLDRPYPARNIPLLEELCDSGAAVSEMPFGWEPRARDFPRRNRIIAGLCLGLVVVEAAFKSGSLISARLAGELGRLVFAVPGSPLDPRARGTNALLKDGAVLATNADDIVDALAPLLETDPTGSVLIEPDTPICEPAPDPPQGAIGALERERIVDAMGPAPMEIDEVVRRAELPASVIYLVLLELELAGRLERHAGGSVALRASVG